MVTQFLEHLGKITIMLKESIGKPENTRVYWKEFMEQCNDIGIRSLPIVVVISFFLGAVLTIQTAYQLISPLVAKPVESDVHSGERPGSGSFRRPGAISRIPVR